VGPLDEKDACLLLAFLHTRVEPRPQHAAGHYTGRVHSLLTRTHQAVSHHYASGDPDQRHQAAFRAGVATGVAQGAAPSAPPLQRADDVNTPDAEGRTPLMRACQLTVGGAELVALLCLHGADYTITDSTGMTAFMIAAAHGQCNHSVQENHGVFH